MALSALNRSSDVDERNSNGWSILGDEFESVYSFPCENGTFVVDEMTGNSSSVLCSSFFDLRVCATDDRDFTYEVSALVVDLVLRRTSRDSVPSFDINLIPSTTSPSPPCLTNSCSPFFLYAIPKRPLFFFATIQAYRSSRSVLVLFLRRGSKTRISE